MNTVSPPFLLMDNPQEAGRFSALDPLYLIQT